jgi:hypothetical protein
MIITIPVTKKRAFFKLNIELSSSTFGGTKQIFPKGPLY